MWQRELLFGVLCVLALIACQSISVTTSSTPNRDCELIIEPDILTLNLDTLPEAEIVEWVSARYGNRIPISERDFLSHERLQWQINESTTIVSDNPNWEKERIQMLTEGVVYESNATTTTYKWMVEKQIYQAEYHNEQQRLLKIEIEFDPQPTLGDLERCFGKPSYYKANFYTHNYEWLILYLVSKPTYNTSFTLYYPEQGLYFFDYRDGEGHEKPGITANTLVRTGAVLRTGSLLDFMHDAVLAVEHDVKDVNPFPETWDDIEYDEP